MARISGIEIPNDKRVVIGLTYIYGVSVPTAQKILKQTKINEDVRVKDLNEDQIRSISSELSRLKIEGELRREKALNIKRLMENGSYRGLRHRKHLPARGQSSKTNARTVKGPRKTVANKKK